MPVSYTHLRAHETVLDLVCRLLLEKKKMRSVVDINWNDNEIVLPAFLTIVLMPFTYSIADGIAWGVITYVAIKVGTQKTSELNPIVWTIAILMTMFYLGPGNETTFEWLFGMVF